MRADLVVFDADPFMDDVSLDRVAVAATMIDGELVFDAMRVGQ